MRVARPRTLRRGCAHARRTVRAVRSTHRGPSTGGVSPGRFRGVWLRRSPPRPSMHGLSVCSGALEVPTTGVRDTRKRVHATLLTLTPTLPSRPVPCGPTCRPDCLSWVCPKIAPPSSRIEESVARAPRLRGLPSGKNSQSFPRSVRVVSHHLDGFLLSDRAGLLRPAPDPGVHRVSCRRETALLTVWFLPFEAFPPPTAADPATTLR